MNKLNISSLTLSIIAISCVLVGGLATQVFFTEEHNNQQPTTASAQPLPLYWVAPMDPNYQRDKPGQSPMGMDLIPVYANDSQTIDEGPGTIKINPSVINNIGVRTEKVQRAQLQNEIKTVGYVNYNQDKLVHIHPRVKGWIEQLNITSVGDVVEKNQAIYSLYSPELVNAQEEFVLALDRKNKRLINAAKNRLMALQIPEQAIERLEREKKVQQKITFYAPQSGVVENLAIREGFYVQPGTTLFSIGDLSEVWVEAQILERQAGFVYQGDSVTMSLDFLPGQTWRGEVDYIYPTLDESTRTMKVRLRFNNENLTLKPNMFAQVIIHTKPLPARIVIAKEALIRTGTQDRVVLALGDGQFKSIAVDAGRSDNSHVEILSGLTTDDTIVISAQFLLDSESSKTSDFRRMSPMTSAAMEMSMDMPMNDAEVASVSARVTGIVNQVDRATRLVNISRGAIEKWQREPATLDFSLVETIDIATITPEMTIDFTFEVNQGEFTITELHHNMNSMH
jgi:Cu(I)/Ag(I) efflux system membrane fusion protein